MTQEGNKGQIKETVIKFFIFIVYLTLYVLATLKEIVLFLFLTLNKYKINNPS